VDVKQLILQGESETLEFKESLRLKEEIGESACAFSNSNGGIILIGVSDLKEIKGVQIGKKTMIDLAENLKKNTDPPIFPEITKIRIDNKEVISLKIKQAVEKPVFYKNSVYKRVGETNQRILSSGIRKLAREYIGRIYWDEQAHSEAGFENIDGKKIKQFIAKAKFERRLGISLTLSHKEVLKRLKLFKNNKLTNAAILLFGKNPQEFFLQAEMRCARFKGTKPLEFIDMKVLGGNIIDLREDGLDFVKKHIRLHAKIKGTERIEKWEYPIEAVREAITNAICHRDYESTANVQIRVFDDRIEILNPGKLVGGLTVDMLRKKHESIPRYPLIARQFFLIKYIEQWGTGTNRIVEQCLDHGLPEPIFEEIGETFAITIRKYHINETTLKELNSRQREIVNYLGEHGKVTRKECMSLLKLSKDTTIRELSELLKKGLIKRLGTGKNIYYYLS